ncbi:hypothetical protein FHS87_004183 [Roseomonas pecuniae]|uniref:Uncharacterized protein n=1 Tax=Muricoccus pecuniae TaxID=693023 RepID=A0A840YMB3_9PROT|nr:hypothetical protein [Roseomonas pecuniae]
MRRQGGLLKPGVIARLGFSRWHVADRLEEAVVVEPVHPLEGGVLDSFQRPPRAAAADDLGLEQPDHRLGERVVIGIANAPDGRLDPGVEQPFRVPNADVLLGFN